MCLFSFVEACIEEELGELLGLLIVGYLSGLTTLEESLDVLWSIFSTFFYFGHFKLL